MLSVGLEGSPDMADVAYAGLNFDGLDLAVLELEPIPGRDFPAPLSLAGQGASSGTQQGFGKDHPVYVVGYPGNQNSTTPDLFARLFDRAKGFKRLAPGTITAAAGAFRKIRPAGSYP